MHRLDQYQGTWPYTSRLIQRYQAMWMWWRQECWILRKGRLFTPHLHCNQELTIFFWTTQILLRRMMWEVRILSSSHKYQHQRHQQLQIRHRRTQVGRLHFQRSWYQSLFFLFYWQVSLCFTSFESMLDILISCTESKLNCVLNSPSSKAGSYWWPPMLWNTWRPSKTNCGIWNSLCCIPYRRRQSNPDDRSSSCFARSLSKDIRNALHTGISVETLNSYSRPTTDTPSAVHIRVPVEIRSRNSSPPTDKYIRTTSGVSTIKVLLIIVIIVKYVDVALDASSPCYFA